MVELKLAVESGNELITDEEEIKIRKRENDVISEK